MMTKNTGVLKLLVVLLVIASAYQLSFTFVTRRVENKAVKYAAQFAPEQRIDKEQSYLDSIKGSTVYNLGFIKFNYNECKNREINLGLDLKGGMNVMLEIAVEDVLVALSNDSQDPIFKQALVKAKEDQKNSTDNYINLFAKAYDQLSSGAPLATIFNTPELRSEINPTSTNAEVIKVLETQTSGAITNSYNVLRNRIDRFGVTQPNIQRIEGSGRILVELPGVKEPERVRKLLQGTASLEFWSTYNNTEIYPMLERANKVVKDYLELQEIDKASSLGEIESETSSDEVAATLLTPAITDVESAVNVEATEGVALLDGIVPSDSASLAITNMNIKSEEEVAKEFPLFAKLGPISDPNTGGAASGPVVGQSYAYDTMAVNTYLSLPQVKLLLPRDIKLMWGVKPVDAAETIYALYAIKANTRDGKAPLDGAAVADATGEIAQHGASAEVSMIMNSEGANKWARLTADNVGNFIAIVLDGYVYSAPGLSGEIKGGRSSITGGFDIQEAKDLANVLKSGKLPAPARIIQDTVVGPSLGQESINSSMLAFLVAFILVMLYMQFFYSTAGFVASSAMILNVFLMFGVLASFGAVLTLPGIAGIILTMGMAVDANVIIYERVKEELRSGKSLGAAIVAGYKIAMSAIIDANLTSIITGVVLFKFGTGPVQGFATTLIIGIATSMFTSILFTRMVFNTMLNKNVKIKFSTRLTENFLTKTKIDFISIRKYSYAISLVLILIAITSFFVRGMNYGVDFTGGRAYVVRFDQNMTADKVRNAVEAEFSKADGDQAYGSFEVKQFGAEDQMRIVTQYKADDNSDDATAKVEQLLHQSLNGLYTTPLTIDEFTTTATNKYGIISADKVGASVAHETVVNSFIAVVFALLAIGIYIVIRFKRWQWGVGSVIALGHDALLTVGLFSVCYGFFPFNLEVDQSFIAAILTIIGYSINDKIVIFDRIREYQNDPLNQKRSIKENINRAINSTLSRTINTSGSTFITLLAIFLFGGEVIRGFIFAMMFGVVVGTLSSIFTATPIAYDFMRRSEKNAEAAVEKKK